MFPPVRRDGSPAVTTRTSVVCEDDLHGVVGAAVEEVVGLGGMRERDAVGDEFGEHELPEQLGRDAEPALAVPARRESGCDPPDLRAFERDSSAVEVAAEVEPDRLAAVPRADHYGA